MGVNKRTHALKCLNCKKDFLGWHSTNKYCSNDCFYEHSKAETKSLGAKPRITYELIQDAENVVPIGESRSKYVAAKARVKLTAVSHALKRYGYKWKRRPRLRNNTLARLPERRYATDIGCVICGEKRVVDAAHVVPAREGGYGWIPNIVPLCPNHHRLFDSGKLTENETLTLTAFLVEKWGLFRGANASSGVSTSA